MITTTNTITTTISSWSEKTENLETGKNNDKQKEKEQWKTK